MKKLYLNLGKGQQSCASEEHVSGNSIKLSTKTWSKSDLLDLHKENKENIGLLRRAKKLYRLHFLIFILSPHGAYHKGFCPLFYEWIMSEPKPWDWLTEHLGFNRTHIKKHWSKSRFIFTYLKKKKNKRYVARNNYSSKKLVRFKVPLSPAKTTFHAEICNPITRQAIELESCSNPLRYAFSKSCSRNRKKNFSFVEANATSGGVFGYLYLGPNPLL